MSEYERTPIVDKNGVHTHRYRRAQVQPSADLQSAAAKVPVRSASEAPEDNSLADIACSYEILESRHDAIPPYARFRVLLEHGSGRTMGVEYLHLSSGEPQARDVLAHLAVRARSAHYSVEDLTLRLGHSRADAEAMHALSNQTSTDLHQLLGQDYDEVVASALDQQPFASPLVRPIAAQLRELSSRMHISSRAAFDEGDIEAYAVLRVLGRDVARSVESDADAEEMDAWADDLDRQTAYLYSTGSYYGWLAESYAQQLRSQLAMLRNERPPLRAGKRASEVPELGVLVTQMRNEEASMGALDDIERTQLRAWSNKLEQLIETGSSASEVMHEIAEVVQQSRLLGSSAGGSVLYGYAMKVRHAMRG